VTKAYEHSWIFNKRNNEQSGPLNSTTIHFYFMLAFLCRLKHLKSRRLKLFSECCRSFRLDVGLHAEEVFNLLSTFHISSKIGFVTLNRMTCHHFYITSGKTEQRYTSNTMVLISSLRQRTLYNFHFCALKWLTKQISKHPMK
jgi:hypothetical protein